MTDTNQPQEQTQEQPSQKVYTSDEKWFENWPMSDTVAYKIIELEKQLAEIMQQYLVAKRRLYAAREMLETAYSDAGLDIRIEIE